MKGEVMPWNALLDEFLEPRFLHQSDYDPSIQQVRDVIRVQEMRTGMQSILYLLNKTSLTLAVKSHGAYWFYWTTHDEVAWKKFYPKNGWSFSMTIRTGAAK